MISFCVDKNNKNSIVAGGMEKKAYINRKSGESWMCFQLSCNADLSAFHDT
jgi:hypothetical protein